MEVFNTFIKRKKKTILIGIRNTGIFFSEKQKLALLKLCNKSYLPEYNNITIKDGLNFIKWAVKCIKRQHSFGSGTEEPG